MATNKKKASSSKKQKRGESEGKKTENVGTTTPPPKPKKYPHFSGAQLCGLLFLSIGFSYIMEYGKILSSTEVCSEYVANVSSCSKWDTLMIRTKYQSGILAFSLTAMVMMFQLWSQESLFLRFNTFLCSSPLITTLMALQIAQDRHDCHAKKLFAIAMMVTTLLAVAAGSIWNAKVPVAPRREEGFQCNLQEFTIVTLLLAHGWELYALLHNGVGGYLRLSKEDDGDITNPAQALVAFVAVDKSTVFGILLFALLFLCENRQRSVLLYVSILYLVSRYYWFPMMEEYLVARDFYENFLSGCAMFSLTASMAPKMSWTGGNSSNESTATTTTTEANAKEQSSKKD